MSEMSEFEIRANNIWTGIQNSENRIKDFGYESEDPYDLMSQIIGMFITWLNATEEVRQNSKGNSGSFRTTIIDKLDEDDDPNWNSYLAESKGTLKNRVKSLWGIRIAFTHGNGDISLIKNDINREYAKNSKKYLPGIELKNNKLKLRGFIIHHAIRTIVQVRDII